MISFTPTARYAVAGVRRVLVAAFAPGTRFVFGTPFASGLPTDLLTELQPAPEWHRLTATDTASASQTATITKSGQRYEQRLALPFVTGFSRLQRHALTALFAQPVYALVEDQQGNWWLAGGRRGLRCTSLNWATGTRAGEILASCALEGTEPEAWFPFSPTAARALYVAADAETDESPPIDEGPDGGGDSL